MATSGLYTYSINRDQLISAAFRTLGVFNDDSPAPATDIANAAQALNLMIKQWMAEGYFVWTVKDITIPLVVGQVTYTIGPSGQVVAPRPLSIDYARLHYTNGLDVPLEPLSRQEYNMLGQKSIASTPNSYYYDKQLINGVLYIYLPSDNILPANSVIVTTKRPLEDMSNSNTDFDFPVEGLNALKWGLAAEMVCEYDVPSAKAAFIAQKADQLKEVLFAGSQEDASVFFTVNTRQG